jgi:3D (Asp-Asp-Asp) domain-containing protein
METNMIKTSYATFISAICMIFITWFFSKSMDNTWAENKMLKEKISELETRYTNKISYEVTVTTYNPTKHQCDDTPNITADGTRIKTWRATEYRYVALSRDLLSRWGGPFNYGDYIVIEGAGDRDGVYQVRDTMNPKWTNRVDILTTNDRFKYDDVVMYKYVDDLIVVNQ